jgi:hypothetical protein
MEKKSKTGTTKNQNKERITKKQTPKKRTKRTKKKEGPSHSKNIRRASRSEPSACKSWIGLRYNLTT